VLMYMSDFDDNFPRQWYQVLDNTNAIQVQTWRETTNPYMKGGALNYTVNGVVQVRGGLHVTPALTHRGVHYGAHQRLFGIPKEGGGANGQDVPSVSQTALDKVSRTLMTTTQGVVAAWDYNPALDGIWDAFWMYADWSQWPPLYTGPGSVPCDKDSDAWPCAWVPRYRYTEGANVAYADGHGKYVKKGALNWCLNIYLPEVGTDGQGYPASGFFDPGGFCSRYSNN
jgi:prepilin-type processing-associated H-X9-DG protein